MGAMSEKGAGKSKVVLVDMDGVLADFELGYQKEVALKHPDIELIPLEKRTIFNSDVQYASLHPHLEDDFAKISEQPGFFLNLPIVEGAKEALTVLDKKYHVFLCTAPKRAYHNCVKEKYQWVEHNLGFEFTKRIVLTKDKTIVQGVVLIDDKPELKGCFLPTWKHVVFDQPYNRKPSEKFRISNWTEVNKLVEYIDSL